MKKTVFLCAGNLLLFTLFGLTFLFPFSEVVQGENMLGGSVSAFPFLLVAVMVAYPLAYWLLAKKYHWHRRDTSELAYLDEREKAIVAEATKAAYLTLMGGLIVVIAAIGGTRLFTLFTGLAISLYAVTVAMLTALLDIATICYCVRWCVEYKK